MRRTAVRRSRREVLRLSAGAAAAALFAACAGDDEQEEATPRRLVDPAGALARDARR